MTFAHPYVLLGLLGLPFLALLKGQQGRRAAFIYSSLNLVRPEDRPARDAAGMILPNLRWLALALLIIALAQPRRTETETSISASGVDIVVALDMSMSMEAMDFQLRGKDVNRLEMAKEVLKNFIRKRPSDRIGLVAFAARPYVAAPLTLDHDFLLQNLERMQLGTVKEFNATAIGSALATSVSRLSELKSKSKIAILMTDGQNNTGKVPPLSAAEAAQALKVKVYTIGVGRRGQSYVLRRNLFGQWYKEPAMVDIDEDTLKKIADLTGGKYYRADDSQRFRAIYDEIDKQEKTEVNVKKFVRHTELAHWMMLAGLLVLVTEVLLANTILRRLP
jgi:Ca-activated chloride channel family protein